jgi:hypothetical protein
MAADFDRVFPFRGWDKDATPKWQMVPVDGDRYLYLNDGKDLTVTSTDTSVVTVTEIKENQIPAQWDKRAPKAGARIFKLRGCSKGNARIQAKDSGGTLKTEVEVDTKPLLTKNVTFYFVKDSASPVHKSRRSPAESSEWVKTINYLYQQCKIKVVASPAAWKTFPGNLGTAIEWTDGATDDWATLRAQRDPGADVTVFQVWEYEQDGSPASDNANGGTLEGDKMSVVEDNASPVHAHTVAHELAHAFGLDDLSTPATQHHLMWGAGRTGQHMDKSEVNKINP